jgi:hypothetical protein
MAMSSRVSISLENATDPTTGDHQMLQWTAAGSGPCFMGLVHHTDAEREWAYDRRPPVGQLDKALDEALAKGWTIVSMKDDGKAIFSPSTGR